MKLKQFTPSCASGFTVIELLVASSVGLLVLALLLSSTLSSKNLFRADVVRTRINQDLRGAMDIIGSQTRVAGENLSRALPAIIVEDNWNSSGFDRLTLRRNLLDEIIKSCEAISASSNADIELVVADEAGCSYADNTHNFNTWHDYREANGGTVNAYLFNSSTKLGEFFEYATDSYSEPDEDTGDIGSYALARGSGLWQNDYDQVATAAYMLEEWRFQLVDGILQLVINESDSPLNVAAGITDFQVVAILQDGTELATFDASQNWTNLSAVRVTMVGQDSYAGKTLQRTLTTEFFPRNVLSN